MKLTLRRFKSDKESTVGVLTGTSADCFIIEDQHQTTKVWGETRIPEGTYNIGLRSEGRFHNRYLSKFGKDFHKGMLCLYNKPNWVVENDGKRFQYILIHIGNTEKDTAGCLLVNQIVDISKMTGQQSTSAYKRLYPIIRDKILKGEDVTITIKDNDK